MEDTKFTKYDTGKPRFSLMPPHAHRAIAEVLTYGAEKYSPNNWIKSPVWSKYLDALERHINAWKAGEDLDEESGLPHLAHAGCCLVFLLEQTLVRVGVDDRICHDINLCHDRERYKDVPTKVASEYAPTPAEKLFEVAASKTVAVEVNPDGFIEEPVVADTAVLLQGGRSPGDSDR